MDIDGALKLTIQLMQQVEDYKDMTGIMKKHWVEHKVIEIMKNEKVDDNIIKSVESLLPSVIDMVVHIAKSSYNFGKKNFKCCSIL